ncbi:MAG: AAA family ATPase [Chlamydiae bacterium]|nr:AAA family ATPase [Chlamydiota bacterium]MBI3276455.1 AAA family ATPase [Chlamydiota bacterium]
MLVRFMRSLISLCVCFSFLFYDISYSVGQNTQFATHLKAVTSVNEFNPVDRKSLDLSSVLEEMRIPHEIGEVTDQFYVPGAPHLFIIEDIHCNSQAQENIQRMLKILQKQLEARGSKLEEKNGLEARSWKLEAKAKKAEVFTSSLEPPTSRQRARLAKGGDSSDERVRRGGRASSQNNLKVRAVSENFKPFHIFCEAADGEMDMSFFWSFPDQRVLASLLKKFLDKNELDGVETFLVKEGPKKVKGVGVEELSDYVENLRAMGELLKERNLQEHVWQGLDDIFRGLSEKIYPKELIELIEEREKYREHKIEMGEYVKQLEAENGLKARGSKLEAKAKTKGKTENVENKSLPLSSSSLEPRASSQNYPQLDFYLRLQALEKKTDASKIESEYLLFLSELEKKLPKEELNEVLRNILEHRLGRTSDEEHYLFLSKYLGMLEARGSKLEGNNLPSLRPSPGTRRSGWTRKWLEPNTAQTTRRGQEEVEDAKEGSRLRSNNKFSFQASFDISRNASRNDSGARGAVEKHSNNRINKRFEPVEKSAPYPNLQLLIQQMSLLKQISWEKLDEEIKNLEGELVENLATTPQAKELLALEKDYDLLRRVIAMEGSREDIKRLEARGSRQKQKLEKHLLRASSFEPRAKYYPRASSQAGPNDFIGDFLIQLGELAKKEAIDYESPDFGEIFNLSQKFYTQVLKRDKIMFEKSLKLIQEKKLPCAALVVGGFHTEGITKKLKEAKIGYWVIAPRMTGHDDRSAYFRKMKEQFGFISGAPDALKEASLPTLQKIARLHFLEEIRSLGEEAAFAAGLTALQFDQWQRDQEVLARELNLENWEEVARDLEGVIREIERKAGKENRSEVSDELQKNPLLWLERVTTLTQDQMRFFLSHAQTAHSIEIYLRRALELGGYVGDVDGLIRSIGGSRRVSNSANQAEMGRAASLFSTITSRFSSTLNSSKSTLTLIWFLMRRMSDSMRALLSSTLVSLFSTLETRSRVSITTSSSLSNRAFVSFLKPVNPSPKTLNWLLISSIITELYRWASSGVGIGFGVFFSFMRKIIESSPGQVKNIYVFLCIPFAAVFVANPGLLGSAVPLIAIILFSAILHEYAHGWLAARLGDRTAEEAGRLTLLRFWRHLDFWGTISFLASTLLIGIPIGWLKPVPISSWRLSESSMKKVALAGPVSNLILAVVFAVGALAANAVGPFGFLMGPLIWGVKINLALGLVNLLPLPSLDGSYVWPSLQGGEADEAISVLRKAGIASELSLLAMTSPISAFFGFGALGWCEERPLREFLADRLKTADPKTRDLFIKLFQKELEQHYGKPFKEIQANILMKEEFIQKKLDEAAKKLTQILGRIGRQLAQDAEKNPDIKSNLDSEDAEHAASHAVPEALDEMINSGAYTQERFREALTPRLIEKLREMGKMGADDEATVRKLIEECRLPDGVSVVEAIGNWLDEFKILELLQSSNEGGPTSSIVMKPAHTHSHGDGKGEHTHAQHILKIGSVLLAIGTGLLGWIFGSPVFRLSIDAIQDFEILARASSGLSASRNSDAMRRSGLSRETRIASSDDMAQASSIASNGSKGWRLWRWLALSNSVLSGTLTEIIWNIRLIIDRIEASLSRFFLLKRNLSSNRVVRQMSTLERPSSALEIMSNGAFHNSRPVPVSSSSDSQLTMTSVSRMSVGNEGTELSHLAVEGGTFLSDPPGRGLTSRRDEAAAATQERFGNISTSSRKTFRLQFSHQFRQLLQFRGHFKASFIKIVPWGASMINGRSSIASLLFTVVAGLLGYLLGVPFLRLSVGESPMEPLDDYLKRIGLNADVDLGNGQKKKEWQVLKDYTYDLALEADSARPLVGRSEEIGRIMARLATPVRIKNSLVLVGPRGVGKTALVELVSLKLARNNLDGPLKGRRIIALKAGALGSTLSEMSDNLKTLIPLLEKTNNNVILFIDEIHFLLKGPSNSIDTRIADLLKPILEKGRVTVIGATTDPEYKAYIEQDKPFEDRFTKVSVPEPSVQETETILTGAKTYLEGKFSLKIDRATIKAAVKCAQRYLSEKSQPRKAIDVLEGTMGRVNARRNSLEMTKEDFLNRLHSVINEYIDLKKEGVPDTDPTVIEVHNQMIGILEAYHTILSRLSNLRKDIRITQADVQEYLADMTGMAVGALDQDDAAKYLNIEGELHKRVVGQEDAIKAVAQAIRRARAIPGERKRPMGVFFMAGPTGVGKTELAKALAQFLFDSDQALTVFNMSEYQESHQKSRLIGSPPGYVGFQEGGQLTEAVRKRPYSVLLFDEIEKAHSDVLTTLMQVFDEGKLTDGQGNTVDFKNTLIIMTSNIGMEKIQGPLRTLAEELKTAETEEATQAIITQMNDLIAQTVETSIRAKYKPEIINRIDHIIACNVITPENIRQIARILLKRELSDFTENKFKVEVADNVYETLAQRGYDIINGARPLRRLIEQEIRDPLSNRILEEMAQGHILNGGTFHIDINPERGFQFTFDPAPPSDNRLSASQAVAPIFQKIMGLVGQTVDSQNDGVEPAVLSNLIDSERTAPKTDQMNGQYGCFWARTPLPAPPQQRQRSNHNDPQLKDAAITPFTQALPLPEEQRPIAKDWLNEFVRIAKTHNPGRFIELGSELKEGHFNIQIVREGRMSANEEKFLKTHLTGEYPDIEAARQEALRLRESGESNVRNKLLELKAQMASIPGCQLGFTEGENEVTYWLRMECTEAPKVVIVPEPVRDETGSGADSTTTTITADSAGATVTPPSSPSRKRGKKGSVTSTASDAPLGTTTPRSPDSLLTEEAKERIIKRYREYMGKKLVHILVSPDGRTVLTMRFDRTETSWGGDQYNYYLERTRYWSGQVWNVETRELLETFYGGKNWVRSAKFSEDGSQVLTTNGDGSSKIVWQLQTSQSPSLALSEEEPSSGNIIGPEVTPDEEAQWRREIEEQSDKVRSSHEPVVTLVEERSRALAGRLGSEIWSTLVQQGIENDEIVKVLAALQNPREAFKWFEARVLSREKYFLGSESALAVNLMQFLEAEEKSTGISDLVDEATLHEALERTRLTHPQIIQLTDKIFNREGKNPLGKALRRFIEAHILSGETALPAASTLQPLVVRRENVHQRITEEVRQALLSEEIGTLGKLIEGAIQSQVDQLLFLTAVNFVILQDRTLLERYQSKLNILKTKMPSTFSQTLEIYQRLSQAMEKMPDNASMAQGGRICHYDLYRAGQWRQGDQWDVPRDRNDLTLAQSRNAVEALLMKNLETGEGNILLDSLQDELGGRKLSLDDIEFPVQVIRLQEGVYQNIYFILTTLKQTKEVIPLVMVMARDAQEKSRVTSSEYQALLSHRGDAELVEVLRDGEVETQEGKVSAYTSRFINGRDEIQYISPHHAWANRIPPGYLLVNTSLPGKWGAFVEPGDMINTLAAMGRFLVRYYNPEAQTLIDGFRINAGDVGVDVRDLTAAQGRASVISGREMKFSLITWRGTKRGIDPSHFLDYYFNLHWLGSLREGEKGYRHESLGQGHDAILRTGVMQGFLLEMMKKHGNKEGLELAKVWLNHYINEIQARKLSEKPLFKVQELKAFISRYVDPALGSFSSGKGVLLPSYWLASQVTRPLDWFWVNVLGRKSLSRDFKEDFVVPFIEEIFIWALSLGSPVLYAVLRVVFVWGHERRLEAKNELEARSSREKQRTEEVFTSSFEPRASSGFSSSFRRIFIPTLISLVSLLGFFRTGLSSWEMILVVGITFYLVWNLYGARYLARAANFDSRRATRSSRILYSSKSTFTLTRFLMILRSASIRTLLSEIFSTLISPFSSRVSIFPSLISILSTLVSTFSSRVSILSTLVSIRALPSSTPRTRTRKLASSFSIRSNFLSILAKPSSVFSRSPDNPSPKTLNWPRRSSRMTATWLDFITESFSDLFSSMAGIVGQMLRQVKGKSQRAAIFLVVGMGLLILTSLIQPDIALAGLLPDIQPTSVVSNLFSNILRLWPVLAMGLIAHIVSNHWVTVTGALYQKGVLGDDANDDQGSQTSPEGSITVTQGEASTTENLSQLKEAFSGKVLVFYAPGYLEMNGVSTYMDHLLLLLAQEIKGLKIHVIVLGGGQRVSPLLKRDGGKVVVSSELEGVVQIHMTRQNNEPGQDLADEVNGLLRKILQEEGKVDLIVSESSFHYAGNAFNAFGKQNKIPVIQEFHSGPWRLLDRVPEDLVGDSRFFSPNTVNILKKADLALTVSESVQKRFQKDFGVEVECLYPVADLSFYDPRYVTTTKTDDLRVNHSLSGKTVILMSGRPVERKGYDVVLDAILGLSNDLKRNAAVVIAGFTEDMLRDGDDDYNRQFRESLYEKIQHLREEGVLIVLLGPLSAEEMRDWYFLSDIVAMPSRRDEPLKNEETFGLVSLEAQSMGKPVIVSRSGGLPETVVDGETGCIVESGNVEAFRGKIEELIRHPNLRVTMGQRARQVAGKRFSREANLERHLKLFLGVMRRTNILTEIKRIYTEINHQTIEEKNILEGIAAIFGLDFANDDERHREAGKILSIVAALPETRRKEVLENIVRFLKFMTWHASGEHRFMPLALAVVNMFEGRDIFSREPIVRFIQINPQFRYLLDMYHLYANPFGVEAEWIPTHLPSLHLSIPHKDHYRWLDIGSAPKAYGAPTLNLLRKTFEEALPGTHFSYEGTDAFFPSYSLESGEIRESAFNSADFRERGQTDVEGVTYLDARIPQNDVMSESFMQNRSAESFDFISLSMTLHHLKKPDEGVERRFLAKGVDWVDESGNAIQPFYLLTQTQQEVVERLLKRLSHQGVCFLNLPRGEIYFENQNEDLYLVIQRVGENQYCLYQEAIPFQPEYEVYSSVEFLITGLSFPGYNTSGIRSLYPDETNAFFTEINKWLYRADLLVCHYQGRDAFPWASVRAAVRAINERKGLVEIFSAYLHLVPEDEPLKSRILEGVVQFHKQNLIQNFESWAQENITAGLSLREWMESHTVYDILWTLGDATHSFAKETSLSENDLKTLDAVLVELMIQVKHPDLIREAEAHQAKTERLSLELEARRLLDEEGLGQTVQNIEQELEGKVERGEFQQSSITLDFSGDVTWSIRQDMNGASFEMEIGEMTAQLNSQTLGVTHVQMSRPRDLSLALAYLIGLKTKLRHFQKKFLAALKPSADQKPVCLFPDMDLPVQSLGGLSPTEFIKESETGNRKMVFVERKRSREEFDTLCREHQIPQDRVLFLTDLNEQDARSAIDTKVRELFRGKEAEKWLLGHRENRNLYEPIQGLFDKFMYGQEMVSVMAAICYGDAEAITRALLQHGFKPDELEGLLVDVDEHQVTPFANVSRWHDQMEKFREATEMTERSM